MNKFLALLFVLSSSPAAASCPRSCEPNGYCYEDECICAEGFAGMDCSFSYNSCPDGILECFNGAECQPLNDYRSSEVYDPASEGRSRSAYSCDCTTAVGEYAFAGKQCEHPHSSVCEQGVDVSDYAFCTNGGQCLKIVRNGEKHAGCKCDQRYEGRHCQYRRGEAPVEELALEYGNEKGRDLSGVAKFSTIAIVLGVVGGAVFLYRRRRTGSIDHEPEHTYPDTKVADLELDHSVPEQVEIGHMS
jgi:hypothetical protein